LATDGELLSRYVRNGEEAGFAEVVRRHGPMVLAACRRLAGQEAEDASQAVFVVLARRAASLVGEREVGPWLHAVCRNVAMAMLDRRRRERIREREAANMRHPASIEGNELSGVQRAEVLARVDAAVEALPEHYRRVVVLCYLQGESQAEAAERLNLPPGTVAARCSRGLERLRARLRAGGGEGPDATALGALLLGEAAGAAQALPLEPFVASALAGAKAAAGSQAATIADAALKIVFWHKVKLAAGLAGAALAVGLAVPVARRAAKRNPPVSSAPMMEPSNVLDTEVFIEIKDKPFPEFMQTLRDKIPGLVTPTERAFPTSVPYAPERYRVTLVTRSTKPEPQVLRLRQREFNKKVEEYNRLVETEGSASWVTKDGAIFFALEPQKPMPVRDLLAAVAVLTDLALVIEGQTPKLVRYTELPLDLDALAADLKMPKLGEGPPELDKTEGAGARNPIPGSPEGIALYKAVLAVRDHPAQDAARVRLLCEMAQQLQTYCWTGMSLRCRGSVVAAAREVLAIMEAPAAASDPAELAELRREPSALKGYDTLLFIAGGMSDDYTDAVKLLKAAARLHVRTCCDIYYDTYYYVLSGARHCTQARFADLAVKAAEEDLARRELLGGWEHHAHYRLGRAYSAAGRHEEAVKEFETALQIDPKLGGVSERLALGPGDPHKAMDFASVETAKANIFAAKADAGRVDEAIAEFRREFVGYQGNNVAPLRFPLEKLLKKHNRQKELADILRERLAAKPDDGDRCEDLVSVLRQEKNLPGALAVCEEFLKRSPGNKQVQFLLERVRKEAGEPAKGGGTERF
jgi:RNA polymerase sigma factor (sigma-70 family)